MKTRWGRTALYLVAGLVALGGGVWTIGLFLPAEHTVSVSRTMEGTAVDAWALLADPGGYPDWRPEVREVDVLAEESGLAGTWREETSRGTVTYRRVEADPPRRLIVEIADEDLPYGGRWTYRLKPVADGVRITITEDGVVHSPLFRFFSRFVFGHDATARAFLDALQQRLESGAS